ncbi:PyrF Orotidine-5'-phosphate decarboxylase [Pyrenophora tritici-repentis]|uniref:Orotidine 5'-phosphate decarboxylase n=2 Tax=Pyrenophora tritici-repentis TaxID=45151 RepID=A0A2W1GCC9_9PLEO|nr:uridine 5'-monophosphate synthase [Pyrenophora tritici-repentis Pt-1C-BFP]KAA8620985.1 Orotidine 5-phosphate decarboxylase [Pyrenophora tritici-repentis]EDU43417.1 uridine 5'-monophosphate synthase [Pyrenophora tritici-repentis Pt-1C-BFP]KAF7450229.1 Orotidine 5'-phosphate decarboxylase [Pyrenophora tritici-repentis]KAG9376197.1 Orotidine 5'-phosphate decarboxylase [Pyrenophora tritici-repentis]KAI0588128.1 Orotidine 5-phosphate decarboxylase [Pyrenophora tritici-repentis]
MSSHSSLTSSYRARAALPTTGPLASYLLRLVSIKQTNLCLSADVETSAELIQLAEDVGDSICLLKTHCDIVTDWSDRTAQALREVAKRKCFLIFEDRKFADIGETVQKQYTSGHHRIALWAEITNAHVLPGPAIVTALEKAAETTITRHNTSVNTEIFATRQTNGADDDDDDDFTYNDSAIESPIEMEGEERRLSIKAQDRKHSVVSVTTSISMRTESISPRPEPNGGTEEVFSLDSATELVHLGPPPFLRSLLLLAEMSSAGHLMTPEYQKETVKIARDHRDFVMGFIAQRSLNTEPEDNFITMTPGCQLPPPGQEGKKLGDALGQQYNTPHKLIFEQGCDIIIVGRGIVRAEDRVAEAERYRKAAWSAYEERIKKA